MPEVKVIAEVGCNHMGQFELAKEFIRMASIFCKADIVKFQKRNPKESLTEGQYNSPHPNPMHAYGTTYGAHREYLEFNLEQHRLLKEHCEAFEIEYSTSVWDLTSAKEISGLRPRFIKIPSACNTHTEMLNWLCLNYEGELHISVGMTTRAEEEKIIELFERHHRNGDLVLYGCTSGYPVAFEDVCLLEINRLRDTYGSRVKEIGFSGHHNGIAVDIAAVTLGATYVERHFTLDRTWKGTDHAASLEPDGLRRLKRDIVAVGKALTLKREEILDVEKVQREKLKVRTQSIHG